MKDRECRLTVEVMHKLFHVIQKATVRLFSLRRLRQLADVLRDLHGRFIHECDHLLNAWQYAGFSFHVERSEI